MPQAVSFFDYSRAITQKFLQTVVAVDDNMNFSSRPIDDENIEIVEPQEDLDIGYIEERTNSSEKIGPLENYLYYQDLSLAFAEKGIVCGGFSPNSDTELSLAAIVNTSKNADITILDWQMENGKNKGELAKSAIFEIAEMDISESGRLRLICVYTNENIEEISEALLSSFPKDYAAELVGQSIIFKHENLAFWKVEIVHKSINERDLTSVLIDSFTKLTAGLLSNAVLSAITEIRDKTHHILHKLNPSLDSAYLSHVFGLLSLKKVREQCHEVAFDYAEELISDEIKSILQISESLKDTLSENVITKWPEYINKGDEDKYFNISHSKKINKRFGNESLHSLLTVKTGDEFEALKPLLDITNINNFEKYPIIFTVNSLEKNALYELSAIECQRRDNVTLPLTFEPALKLGTIIRLKDTDKYYICLQPLCDSTRVTETKSFLLLSVKESVEDYTHVIKFNGKFIYLKSKTAAELVTTARFKHCPITRSIIPTRNGNNLSFKAIGEFHQDEIVFDWIAELKIGIASSIVNELASNISRVGLDTFEWLRLK